MATAGCMAKGRSPSPALNYLCRQRAAATLAARVTLVLPWTETSRMPADGVSRFGLGAKAPGSSSVIKGPGGDLGALPQESPPFSVLVD